MNDPHDTRVADKETIRNRKIALELARRAASNGDPLAGMLSELERAAEPFFLGLDNDHDDSDLDVFP